MNNLLMISLICLSVIILVDFHETHKFKAEYQLNILNDSIVVIKGFHEDTIPFKYIQEYIIKDNE